MPRRYFLTARTLAAGLAVALFFSATAAAREPTGGTAHFDSVKQRLARDGFSAKRIQRLFQSPRVAFDTRSVSLFFVHSEARLNYGQFATPAAIGRAERYLADHAPALIAAESEFGVDREIITAILLVETQLGTMTGRSNVFNALATMAALTDPAAKKSLWKAIPKDRRISGNVFEKKAATKSKWAYSELKALIRYSDRERMDPSDIVGSYAGAMGISQFMPSNALRLAIDGNRDGRIDLFTHEDAIASVGNYLRHHGWRPGIAPKKAYKVILRYNYSSYYAKIILKIAKKLKSG
jgi:peptidoglycan lytic transglycosylase B